RRNREQADRIMDRMRNGIDRDGFGFAAVELKETGECLGFTGLSTVMDTPPVPDGAIEIGWRLAAEHWGRGYASEAANAWLRFGFDALGLEEIIAFAVKDNHRSTAVMKRIGMVHRPERDFLHPRISDGYPHLRPHVLYAITREQWEATN